MRRLAIVAITGWGLLALAGCDVESFTQPPSKLQKADADSRGAEKLAAPPTIAPPPVVVENDVQPVEAPQEVAVVEAVEPEPPPPPRFESVSLASGATVSRKLYAFDRSRMLGMFGGRRDYFVHLNDDHLITGAYAYAEDKLSGPAVTYAVPYTSDMPFAVTGYEGSQRDGDTWIWDEQGQMVLWAVYRSGRKHGPLCLLRDGMPWFVQDWRSDALRGQYVVELHDNQWTARELSADRPADQELLSLAMANLESIEQKLTQQEQLHKREFGAFHREEEQRQRRSKLLQSVPSQNPAKVEEIRRQAEAKRENSALVARWKNSLWRVSF